MLSINENARDYILTKGGCVHVLPGDGISMCCGCVNLGPSVKLGKPPHAKGYIGGMINGINVYQPKNFYSPYPLTIGLGELFGMKSLRVEGWKLI